MILKVAEGPAVLPLLSLEVWELARLIGSRRRARMRMIVPREAREPDGILLALPIRTLCVSSIVMNRNLLQKMGFDSFN